MNKLSLWQSKSPWWSICVTFPFWFSLSLVFSELWLPIALKCDGRLNDTEKTEMLNGVWLFFLTSSYTVFPFPFFVLCMCSFLTRSRGNAHSSSSSICSVNSLWVITSLLQFLNPPITLLSSLFFCCLTLSSSGVIMSFFCVNCPKQHDSSSVITPSGRAAWVFQYFHYCVLFLLLPCDQQVSQVSVSVTMLSDCLWSTPFCLGMIVFNNCTSASVDLKIAHINVHNVCVFIMYNIKCDSFSQAGCKYVLYCMLYCCCVSFRLVLYRWRTWLLSRNTDRCLVTCWVTIILHRHALRTQKVVT